MPEQLGSEPGLGSSRSKLPVDKARSELRSFMIHHGRNPFIARQLRMALKSVDEKGIDLTNKEFRTIVKEANTNILGHELLRAAQNGDASSIAKLIADGAPVNFRDPRTGATALHYTAAYRARPASRVLLNSGQCDFLIRDNKGRRAWELAISADDFALTRLLSYKARKQAIAQGVPFRRREPAQP